jgi:sugar phosphate isomerase/epimerase
VPVFVENSIANPVFCRAEAYVALCEKVPGLLLCLDIGHLFLDARKYDFDAIEFAREVAPFVGSFHVYGNTLDEDFEFSQLPEKKALRKHPPHPSQSPADGWLDNEAILRTVLAIQPEALVSFEVHYQMDVDRAITREGLQWTRKVCLEAQIPL